MAYRTIIYNNLLIFGLHLLMSFVNQTLIIYNFIRVRILVDIIAAHFVCFIANHHIEQLEFFTILIINLPVWFTQNESFTIFCPHRLSREIFVYWRENVGKLLGKSILPYIKQNIGSFFGYLTLRNGDPFRIIILVPHPVIRVFANAYVVAKSERSIVVDDTAKIILTRYSLTCKELVIINIIAQIQVVDWKLNHSLQLTSPRSHSLKTFQGYGQNRRWSKCFKWFLVLHVIFTSTAIHLFWQFLKVVKLLDALFQVDYLFADVAFELKNGRMSHDFIRSWVVFLLYHIWVPLDSDMALLKKVPHWYLIGLDDAATTLLTPVTLRTGVTLAVHQLQNKRLETLLLPCIAHIGLPILLIPPLVILFVVFRILVKDVLSNSPYLLIDSATWRL